MTTEAQKKDTKWEPGKSGNPNGRPRGTGKPVSKLRSTLNKLKALERDSIANIERAVKGEEVEKAQLETSKWVITTLGTFTRAAIAEESARAPKDKEPNDEDDDLEEKEEKGEVRNFSTKLVVDNTKE